MKYQCLKSMIGWEMGSSFGDVEGVFTGKSQNYMDLAAINSFFQDTGRKVESDKAAGKVPDKNYKIWTEQWDDWRPWYATVESSWYISDEDISFARKKRDNASKNLDPEGFAWVQKFAHEKKSTEAPSPLAMDWQTKAGIIAGALLLTYLFGSTVIKTVILKH